MITYNYDTFRQINGLNKECPVPYKKQADRDIYNKKTPLSGIHKPYLCLLDEHSLAMGHGVTTLVLINAKGP